LAKKNQELIRLRDDLQRRRRKSADSDRRIQLGLRHHVLRDIAISFSENLTWGDGYKSTLHGEPAQLCDAGSSKVSGLPQ
jgi:hypothetical protein